LTPFATEVTESRVHPPLADFENALTPFATEVTESRVHPLLVKFVQWEHIGSRAGVAP